MTGREGQNPSRDHRKARLTRLAALPELRASAARTVLTLLALALLTAYWQPTSVFAQEDPELPPEAAPTANETPVHDDIEDLDLLRLKVPTVVTAGRHEQKITAVPYAMSVITAADIRQSGARSIADALRLVPGMDLADLAYGISGASPRGSHGALSNQALVLVDGRQIYDSVFGGTLWDSWPFQLEDIERIEVIRGPGGVTWGANAVNGVINIITKDPRDQLGLTITSGGGSRGTFKQHIGYAFEDGRLRLRFSGEYEASDGFHKGGSLLRRLDDDYKSGRASVHAIVDEGDDRLTLSAGNALLDGGYPPPPAGLLMKRRNSGSQASFILGKWDHRIAPDNNLSVTGYVNDFHVSNGVPSIDYRYQQYALQFSHTYRPSDKHTLTWGIDTRLDHADATNSDPLMLSKDPVNMFIVGAYVQDGWRPTDRWTATIGARLDYDSYGGFEPSARAAISYQLSDNSSMFGSVSRAFHMLPGTARFLSFPLFGGLVEVRSDRNVRPLTVIAYELGYRGRHAQDRLHLNLNLFWHEHSDAYTLTPRLGPPGLACIYLDNRGPYALYGVEADARYALTDSFTLLAHYTYQQLNWSVAASIDEQDVITPPKHKAMIGVRYSPTADLHLSGHLHFVDATCAPDPGNPFAPRHVDPYLRLDLRGEYEFWDDRASIAVGVRNLLDPDHYEGGSTFFNDAEVPRMLFAEFRLAIK